MKLALAAALCLFLLLAQPLAAQAPDSKLTFEVASVKPTGEVVPGRMLAPLGGPGTDDPGRISWPRTTLFFMMEEAYDVTADQITGLNWLNTAGVPFYAVDASIPPRHNQGAVPPDAAKPACRPLPSQTPPRNPDPPWALHGIPRQPRRRDPAHHLQRLPGRLLWLLEREVPCLT
jgi:hypothetical protein